MRVAVVADQPLAVPAEADPAQAPRVAQDVLVGQVGLRARSSRRRLSPSSTRCRRRRGRRSGACARTRARRPTVEVIRPAGPDRAGQAPDGRRAPARRRSLDVADGGAVQERLLGQRDVWVRPSGVNSRSRIAASQVLPVSFSITRPAARSRSCSRTRWRRAGGSGRRRRAASTYFSRQSSPRPVSVKTSPSMPLVWVSRCRIVTLLGDVGVGEPQLGQHLDDRRVEVEQALVDQLHDDAWPSRPW